MFDVTGMDGCAIVMLVDEVDYDAMFCVASFDVFFSLVLVPSLSLWLELFSFYLTFESKFGCDGKTLSGRATIFFSSLSMG